MQIKLSESRSVSGFLSKNAIYPAIPFVCRYYVREKFRRYKSY